MKDKKLKDYTVKEIVNECKNCDDCDNCIFKILCEVEFYNLTDKILNKKIKKPAYKRMKLSDFEYLLLEHFSEKYKYIARDQNGDLNLYVEEPEKGPKFFDTCDDYYEFYSFNDYFKMIEWEVEQSSLISDLLKGRVEEL